MRIRPGDVAVVTGAGSGIGRAVSLALAKKGCRLVLGDIDGERARAVAETAAARYCVVAEGVACDVRCDDDVARLFAATGCGRPADIAVLNAGMGYYRRVEDTPPDELAQLFDTNVLGVQRGILAAVAGMRRQQRGAIVITGSINGLVGWPYHGAYAATKFALTGLAQTLRMELRGSGVDCTLVLPANVDTGFYAAASARGYEAAPIGRTVSAAYVARRVVHGIEHGQAQVVAGPPFVGIGARIGQVLPGVAARIGGRWGRKYTGR